jgi:hypothetical protein
MYDACDLQKASKRSIKVSNLHCIGGVPDASAQLGEATRECMASNRRFFYEASVVERKRAYEIQTSFGIHRQYSLSAFVIHGALLLEKL